MSTPNPLVPQGTFQAASTNVRLAVATIVAIHVVFFGGLLLQGCKRDANTLAGAATNAPATNLVFPALDTSSLFYTNAESLPGSAASNSTTVASLFNETAAAATNAAQELWKSTNLTGAIGSTAAAAGASASGATKEYSIVRGDSFSKIAKANKTTVDAIRQANPEVDPAKIRPGMKLQVPAPPASATIPSTSGSSQAAAPAPSVAAANTYVVKAGDTLTRIAQNNGVTVSQLRSANNLKTSRLNVGQKLKIPAKTAPAAGTNTAKLAP